MKRLLGLIIVALTMINVQANNLPLSVAISAGQWILKDTKRVYYVRVEGRGRSGTEARSAAFRKAVELAVGTLVLGESVTKNDELIRNDVISYSSGYVEDFKIISDNGNVVVVDVWVSDSKIANRLETMGVSTTGTIDGNGIRRDWERRNTQIQTERERDAAAYRMTESVLNDYPRAAYQIKVSKTYLGIHEGQPALAIQAKLEFSQKYADAIVEVFEKTRHGRLGGDRYEMLQIEKPWLNFTRGYWTDNTRERWIKAIQRPVSVEINFGDHVSCWDITTHVDGQYYGTIYGSSTFVINTRKTSEVKLMLINMPEFRMSESRFVNWISGMNKVEARVVDSYNCGK